MSSSISILWKSLVIAFVAAVAAWLPMGVLNWIDGGLTFQLFPIALLGSFAVGLPIALLSFFLARVQLRGSPQTAFLMANLSGVMLLLVSFIIAGRFGLVFLGVPSVIAANVFAALGYLWILKPQRVVEYA